MKTKSLYLTVGYPDKSGVDIKNLKGEILGILSGATAVGDGVFTTLLVDPALWVSWVPSSEASAKMEKRPEGKYLVDSKIKFLADHNALLFYIHGTSKDQDQIRRVGGKLAKGLENLGLKKVTKLETNPRRGKVLQGNFSDGLMNPNNHVSAYDNAFGESSNHACYVLTQNFELNWRLIGDYFDLSDMIGRKGGAGDDAPIPSRYVSY